VYVVSDLNKPQTNSACIPCGPVAYN